MLAKLSDADQDRFEEVVFRIIKRLAKALSATGLKVHGRKDSQNLPKCLNKRYRENLFDTASGNDHLLSGVSFALRY